VDSFHLLLIHSFSNGIRPHEILNGDTFGLLFIFSFFSLIAWPVFPPSKPGLIKFVVLAMFLEKN